MGAFTQTDWYDTPALYDYIFDVDTGREADFLEELHARFGASRGKRAFEPACGSGRLVHALVQRGWRVTGTDLSQPMLDHARGRLREDGLRATLKRADMAQFESKSRFDLAHCLVSSFKYLLSERAARSHLRCVACVLAPGGLYVLGFHLSSYDSDKRNRERWVVERAGVRVVCNIQDGPPDRASRLEPVRSRLVVEAADDEVRRSETNWQFRTYDAAEVRRLLRAVPELEHVATYDFNYDLECPRELDDSQLDLVLVLRRRAGVALS